jgi:hypothetical protein
MGVLTGQPTVLASIESCHEGGQGGYSFWLFLAEVRREPFIAYAVFERGHGLGVWTIDDLILICQKMVLELPS